MEIVRVIQVSDTHLFADKKDTLLKVNTYNSFKTVMQQVEAEVQSAKKPFLVFTGDVSQDEKPLAYQHIVDNTQHLNCDMAWLPGNHDDPQLMQKVFSHCKLSAQKHFIIGNWQLILLDSHWPQHVTGFLAAHQLQWLDKTLQENSQHALIFVHHHVLPVGCDWLDPQLIKNHTEFLEIIDRYPQIQGIVSGHVHQESEQIRDKVRFITAPSTSIQFKPHSVKFALDTLMPGYRTIDLLANGNFVTDVHRVKHSDLFVPDLRSQGY